MLLESLEKQLAEALKRENSLREGLESAMTAHGQALTELQALEAAVAVLKGVKEPAITPTPAEVAPNPAPTPPPATPASTNPLAGVPCPGCGSVGKLKRTQKGMHTFINCGTCGSLFPA